MITIDAPLMFGAVLSSSGTVLFLHSADPTLLDVSRDRMVGKPVWEAAWCSASPESVAALQKAVEEAAQGKMSVCETGRVPMEWTFVPVFEEGGQVGRVVVSVRDLARIKATKAEVSRLTVHIREEERRLNDAQQAAHIGSWEFDITTSKITWSPETFRILRLDPAHGEPDYVKQL
ncbi:MAG: PAS domain-containing protein, partial [Fibrella sp.]|nr:PAS domain-containing protein [Armatimonadota bacterium]